MRKPFTILFIIISIMRGFAQDKEVKISDLRTPVSPGFVLSDQTPSSIDRPSNPKAILVSLLNLKNGGAIEVTPYWLTKLREDLTYRDNIKKKSPIAQTLSFSVASFKTDSNSVVSGGLRFIPLRIYGEFSKSLLELELALADIGTSVNQDTLFKKIAQLKKGVKDFDNRPIFQIEIAAATLFSSKNNSFENLSNNKNGVWANFRYAPEKNFEIIALTRYIRGIDNVNTANNYSNFDAGISLGYEKNSFSLNAEFVNRYDFLKKENFKRIALITNYQISENLYFIGSFGKNFNKIDNMIALFGINIGISKDALKL